MYGIAVAALGMLSTLTTALTIDGYGPISDNAGGICEMANAGPTARARTDALDAAGNTTAAIGIGHELYENIITKNYVTIDPDLNKIY